MFFISACLCERIVRRPDGRIDAVGVHVGADTTTLPLVHEATLLLFIQIEPKDQQTEQSIFLRVVNNENETTSRLKIHSFRVPKVNFPMSNKEVYATIEQPVVLTMDGYDSFLLIVETEDGASARIPFVVSSGVNNPSLLGPL